MNTASLAFANGEDMAELASTMLVGHESMYVAVFKEACHGVLSQEAYLFSNEERDYLTRTLDLPYDALYLLVRLSLRKLKWHRQADLESHYLSELVSKERIRSACDLLSAKSPPLTKLPTSQLSKLSVPLNTKNTYSVKQVDIIDLTISDDDDDGNAQEQSGIYMRSTTQINAEETQLPAEGGMKQPSLAYHASNHSCAGLHELLDTLSAKEREGLARDVKVYTPGMKSAGLISALLSNSRKQTTLNFKGKSPLEYKDRITAMVVEKLGYCIILNESVLSLFRRIHVVYFRTSVYDPQLFVPAILVRCKKRNYVQYEHQRTEGIFRIREELLEYEEALAAETKMELARDAYTTGITKGSGTAQKLFEEVYTWVHTKYAEQLEKINVKRARKDSLERFETGHVLVRILHHCGELVNKIKGACAEAELLRMLLRQTRWKRGSRGRWYDRLGLLLMKDKDDKAALQEAINIVRGGLKDEFTQLRYRPSLCRRLARLENMLSVPVGERWRNEATLSDCDHVYVEGIRLDEVVMDKFGPFKSASRAASSSQHTQASTTKSSRSVWSGKEMTVNVEQLAIEYYESLGYQAIHSEGSVVRFIFALLFKDILFKPILGALETEYQTGPLDLGEDSFYFVRQKDIIRRLEEIESGQGPHIARQIDAEHRDKKTMWVGALWDRFTRDDILAIIEYLPASVLTIICRLQAENYSGSGGGVPDLIVWNHKKREAKFVEVKGPGDTLSETQKLWIHWLLSFNGLVEVCHIETPAGKKGRLEKEKRKAKRSGKAKGKTSPKKAESVADSDFDELESEVVDGIQECLLGKKRKSHTNGDGYRPQKKGRTE